MNFKENINLSDTIALMNSEYYKKRFKAEYYQLEIRCEKLHNMIEKYEKGELEFEPSCPIEMLKKQLSHMREYLWILEERAAIEGVNLFISNIKERTVLYDLR